jgi:hypothetical protein
MAERDYFHPPGFRNGGYVDGPTSGYTVPVTFHGEEVVAPENKTAVSGQVVIPIYIKSHDEEDDEC